MPGTGPRDALTLDSQLCFALYSASRAITSSYRAGLDGLGLTYSQYAVLLVLWQQRKATLSEIGERLQLDSGTLSPLLKRLERQGLLTRARGSADERTLVVELTPAGEELYEPARAVQAEVEARTGLSGPELAAMREQLHALSARLRGVLPAAGEPAAPVLAG